MPVILQRGGSGGGASGPDNVARQAAAQALFEAQALTPQAGEVIPAGEYIYTPFGRFKAPGDADVTLDDTDPQTLASLQSAGLVLPDGGDVTQAQLSAVDTASNERDTALGTRIDDADTAITVAQDTATDAASAASNAQSAATSAAGVASNAQSTASNAQSTADDAAQVAADAKSAADANALLLAVDDEALNTAQKRADTIARILGGDDQLGIDDVAGLQPALDQQEGILADLIPLDSDLRRVTLQGGVMPITETKLITGAYNLEGHGSGGPTGVSGTIIDNTTDDIVAIEIDGTTESGRVDGMELHGFQINHEAATKYAITLDDAPFAEINDIYINCDSKGLGGVLFGDQVPDSSSLSYMATVNKLRVRRPLGVGVRVNSAGTQWRFDQCHIAANDNGAIAGLLEKEGVEINQGQWGSRAAGGIGVSDFNSGAADRAGNIISGVVFEGFAPAGTYNDDGDLDPNGTFYEHGRCTSFNGNTRSVVGGKQINCHANMSVTSGVMCYFGRAKKCAQISPHITNPTNGGILAEWSADSQDCYIEVDYDAAQSPVIVDPSAVRATKIVTTEITPSQLSNITTAPNLTTILAKGVQGLPHNFIPVHNGVEWNFKLFASADNTVTQAIAPTERGSFKLYSNRNLSVVAQGVYDVGSAPEIVTSIAGSRIETGSGIPDNAAQTDNRLAIFAHSDGIIYVSDTYGSQSLTLLLESMEFGL